MLARFRVKNVPKMKKNCNFIEKKCVSMFFVMHTDQTRITALTIRGYH